MLIAQFVRVASDWDWLVAMGDHIRSTGRVPESVPFAAADTSGWHNVPVLAELIASVVHDGGYRGAVLAHLVLLAATLVVVATAARARGASDGSIALAIALLGLGALATLGTVRAQTLSLLPFALLLALVCSQARSPDRRIWWAVPLVAVWANLHGAALLGVCVLGSYLVVDRLRHRPSESVGVGVASLLALCATPQGWLTPSYYAGVFDNVSAQRGEGLWARPSVSMPFDVLMLVAVAMLLVVFVHDWRRMRDRASWEYVACLGLCLATASAARHGVWLLVLLAVLVRTDTTADDAEAVDGRDERVAVPVSAGLLAVIALAISMPIVLLRGEGVLGATPSLVAEVSRTAGSRVVLAPSPLAEALAVDGVRLWVVNPLDAFAKDDQAAYLDFLAGRSGASSAIDAAGVVVARDGSEQAALMSGETDFDRRNCGPGWSCFVRR